MEYLAGEQLWQRVIDVSASALRSGALQSIPTRAVDRTEVLNNTRVPFQVRVVENLARKSEEMKKRAAQTPADQDFNPFLPYDPELYVGELTGHYRCLLNKFNVMEHHILMVTNRFVTQLEPLSAEDFLAAQVCLEARDGLVFYNGGPAAGASITHKHLQMVPLPLGDQHDYPFSAFFATSLSGSSGPGRSPLPFKHQVARSHYGVDTASCAEANWHTYQSMVNALGLNPGSDGLAPAHNLLITREFIWVVPRCAERHQGLAVNALGFAGTILVKNQAQLEQLDTLGCLALLTAVAQS